MSSTRAGPGRRHLSSRRILLDCRWLGAGGIGRVTELLIRGLAEIEPPGRWTLWGSSRAEELLWTGARHAPARAPARSMWGQAALPFVPPHDAAIYPAAIRPFRPGPSITVIHDTIPLRYGGSRGMRALKRAYLITAARISSRILTASQFSRACIERDLHVPASRIDVLEHPVDPELVDRVATLRTRLPRRDVALFVGRFAAHKNLRRLILAFGLTRFRGEGGELLLVGGSPAEVAELQDFARGHGSAGVKIEGPCPQTRLEELYATSRLLVMPSLEEGLGLPAWEAMCCGLALCVSDGGALPELVGGRARTFPARSIPAMAKVIDETAVAPTPPDRPRGASLALFAGQFLDALARAT